MADDALTVLDAAGATQTLGSVDIGSGKQAQKVVVSPRNPTVVSGAQYDLEVTTGAVITLTVPSGATHCLLTVEDNDVRFTEDGSTPSTGADGNGLLLPAGFIGELAIPGGSGSPLKFIGVSGTGDLNVTYRKYA